MSKEITLMDEKEIDRVLTRMAHQILERNKGVEGLALVGIRTGGVFLAQRLKGKIMHTEQVDVPMGILDITLYRDDWSMIGRQPLVHKTEIGFPVEDQKIILVDDVLFTGRTVRAALDALMDFGRPKGVELAVLIDRGHRELPIEPQYVGKKINTALSERVNVFLKELGGEDKVILETEAGFEKR
ncbi:MAG: bifunctional pyr operon transcriptional regulator/uracil phosphoribosyltransferase PyrR [Thermodesulfobacteriota bacterium]